MHFRYGMRAVHLQGARRDMFVVHTGWPEHQLACMTM